MSNCVSLKNHFKQFGQLTLTSIVKIVATKCQILRLKCTTIDFGWRSAPGLAGGAYSAPPDSLAAFKGPTYKRRWTGGRAGGSGRLTEDGEG